MKKARVIAVEGIWSPRSRENVDLRLFLWEFRTQTELNQLPRNVKSQHLTSQAYNLHNGVRMESIRSHVRPSNPLPQFRPQLRAEAFAKSIINRSCNSYNKYLSVAARVVRRSLKDDKRLAAERRGEMELRFAKWTVS